MSKKELLAEIDRLNRWLEDLLSGMYINCVYCGHRYDPGTPAVRDQVLYAHIKTCPKHPLSALNKAARRVLMEAGPSPRNAGPPGMLEALDKLESALNHEPPVHD